MPLQIKIKKRLPARRLSVTLPAEIHAKLELYQRLLEEGVRANDVIAEALRLCFDADKDFRRIWEEETARKAAGLGADLLPPRVISGVPRAQGTG